MFASEVPYLKISTGNLKLSMLETLKCVLKAKVFINIDEHRKIHYLTQNWKTLEDGRICMSLLDEKFCKREYY